LSGSLPAFASVFEFNWYKDGTAMAYRVDFNNDDLPDLYGRGGPFGAYSTARLNGTMTAGSAVKSVYRFRP